MVTNSCHIMNHNIVYSEYPFPCPYTADMLPQGSEMSEMVSLKMVVRFDSSLNMGERLLQKLYIVIFGNAISGHILHKIQYIHYKQRDTE